MKDPVPDLRHVLATWGSFGFALSRNVSRKEKKKGEKRKKKTVFDQLPTSNSSYLSWWPRSFPITPIARKLLLTRTKLSSSFHPMLVLTCLYFPNSSILVNFFIPLTIFHLPRNVLLELFNFHSHNYLADERERIRASFSPTSKEGKREAVGQQTYLRGRSASTNMLNIRVPR